MRVLPRGLAAAAAAAVVVAAAPGVHAGGSFTITFDDLPNLPPLDAGANLADANAGSLTIQGVTFDERFDVFGRDFHIDNDPVNNPPYGVPASGDYYISNGQEAGSAGLTNDGVLLETSSVLVELSAGRNEYRGFSNGGADQITVIALGAGGVELASLVFDLPEEHPGEPEPLKPYDTSSFLGFAGAIEGYRIDRNMIGQDTGNYVLDSLTFVVASPAGAALAGVGVLGVLRRRRPRLAGA